MLRWFSNLLLKNHTYKKSDVTEEKPRTSIDELVRQGFELHESGKDVEAAVIFKKILNIDPFHADSLYLLGVIVNKFGDKERGIELIEKAILYKSDEPFFYRSLGDIYLAGWKLEQAANNYERALTLEPDSIPTLLALGSAHEHLRKTKSAEEYFLKVLQLEANCAPALNKLAEVLLDSGKADLAIPYFKKAHTLDPKDFTLYSSYLFSLNYTVNLSAQAIFEEHKRFDDIYGFGKINRKTINPNSSRRLKIGYISPDFRLHAVSSFFEPVLAHHNRSEFEVFCYHLHQVKDDVSLRLQSMADHWIECSTLSDDALFKKIQEDQIDILIDLAGHTSYSRLLVMARKPSPIQITWLGYINTTGLSAVDYRIVDHYSDPHGIADQYHSEKLLRLSNSQWCYSKLEQSVDVSPLPMTSSGLVTFGSFNRFSKLSKKILTLWARILVNIKESELHVVDVPDDERKAMETFFVEHGVNVERIKLHGRVAYQDFVALHHHVDIAFDAHPYSGATTTCDSLWMGVPTLTLVGETSISRSTSSIMQTLGLSDWIANTEEKFVEIAKKQSSDVTKLAELRAGLRQRMQSSPLMDAELFTKNLEAAYRGVWIEKCNDHQSA